MKKITQIIKSSVISLFLLILIAFPFRLYHLNYPILDSFNFRQAQTATIALNFYKNGINLFQTELDIFGIGKERFLTLEFPLYEATVALIYRLFSLTDIWAKLVSITAGFLGAIYLYKLVRLVLKNELIAFFSAFFFLFAPLNIFYHRAVMIEPFVIYLLLTGLYYCANWIDKQDKKSYFFSLVFLTLGFVHKGLYGPFWLLPVFIYFLKIKQKKKLSSLRFFILITLPLAILFIWQRHVNINNTLSGQLFFTTSNSGHLEWNFGFLSDRLSYQGWLFRLRQILNGIMLKPGLLLFFIGVFYLKKHDKNRFFTSFLISQFIYFLVLFRIQQQNYYQTVMIPAFSVICAVGLVAVISWLRKILKIFNLKKCQRIKYSALFISFFCAFFIYKSWSNTLPSYYIDWDWYQRMKLVGNSLHDHYAGIFAVPGNDWNSVYTYIIGKKLLTTGVENISDQKIEEWRKEGYTFLILHEYEKYPQYLAKSNSTSSLDFLRNYKEILFLPEFQVYIFD